MTGVILYGPPAAGKDTVTGELTKLDPRYRHFRRLKAGPGRTNGYRMVSDSQLDQLRSDGRIIWETFRYGARYVVDRDGLETLFHHQLIPVVHLGEPDAIAAIQRAMPHCWVVVYLHCSRTEASTRLHERAPTTLHERLAVWDATPPIHAVLTLDTGLASAPEVATTIDSALHTQAGASASR